VIKGDDEGEIELDPVDEALKIIEDVRKGETVERPENVELTD
jgi:hypothetical protein